MKVYIKSNSNDDKIWQSYLSEDVYDRLCDCTSMKKDIIPLASAYYNYSPDVSRKGMSKQDCLDYILQWVLEWNGALWSYSDEEYQRWLNKM